MPFLLSDLDERYPVAGYRGEEHVDAGPSWHSHATGQLAWSVIGPARMHTPAGVWIAPPSGAIWVPPGCPHDLVADFVRCLYFDPALCDALPAESCIVAMTPAASAAADATLVAIEARRSTAGHVAELLPLIADAGLNPLQDPFPLRAEASPFVCSARQVPWASRSASTWASLTGMSASALARAVATETGMALRRWQRQLRLLHGLHLQAAGGHVRDVSRQVGYQSASHYVTAFKASLGATPGHYFAPLQKASRAGSITRQRSLVATASAHASHGTPAPRAGSAAGALMEASVVELPMGKHNHVHAHDCGELTWPVGAQSLSTTLGTWVGHEQLALWVPAGCEHETQIWGRVRVFLLHPDAKLRLPERPCAVRLAQPLRRALLELLPSREPRSWEKMTATLLEQACDAGVAPLPLPLLRPRRLAPLVEALRRDPSLERTLADWASRLGVSRRTLARLFQAELGISFGQLRRLMQVRRTVELLALGESVAGAARCVGYAHVAKFIAMFRRTVGSTPGSYFREGQRTISDTARLW